MHLESAFVLSRRPYGDTSLLLELLTPNSGRLAAIARGARRQAGRRGGHVQPFVPLELAWSGRGEVKTLTRAEAAGLPLLYQGEVLFFGYYLNELLLRLLPRQEASPAVFHRYAETLQRLAVQEGDEWLLRRFEVDLLALLGYDLGLTNTVDGATVMAELRYHYRLDHGVQVAAADAPDSWPGQLLLALASQAPFDPELITPARLFMRPIMRHYLGERPLKSRELFRAVYKRKH